MPNEFEEVAEEMSRAALEERLERLAAELRSQTKLSKTLVSERDNLRQQLEVVGRIASTEIVPPAWMTDKSSGREHHATPTLLLTDTHFDEVVVPSQVDWINSYNREIAELRLNKCINDTIKISREYFSGLVYDGMLLMLGGDIFSGIIHQELRETNVEPILKSINYWEDRIASAIDRLATEYGTLHVACTYGNHGRQSRKPVAKHRAWDNYEWLMYQHLAKYFGESDNITWQIPDAADCMVTSYGVRYLLTHGDQFRGGSGIAAALSPLLLGSHRKTRRAAASGRPYDVMILGHFHQHMWMPSRGFIAGGALKGFDEYAYTSNFEPEPPNQAMWLTTPEHGITFPVQVFCGDREAEGW